MKVAVSATGTDLRAQVDPRFGRARYILIVDDQNMAVEVIDNEKNLQAFKGAGIQAATTVSDRGAAVLLTGYCGPNAFKTLTAGGVRVVQEVSGTVGEAVRRFADGELAYSEMPNAEGHW